ncbi:MAG: DIP1984 family protein [Ruminococcus sp.]|nr:DIP1984 family protein [Ruminococcus sp.]
MKLAEALQERADLNNKISSLRERIRSNAIVQEGEKPAEKPADLLKELDSALTRLEELVKRINFTNSRTVCEERGGRTMTELIAEKDTLRTKISVYTMLVTEASQTGQRARYAEIRLLSTVDVVKMQKAVDEMSAELRKLDNAVQALNWTTELL